MALERILRWALVTIAIAGLAAGIAAHFANRPDLADLCWTLATAPVIAGLAVSMLRDLLAGRLGVDAIALVSMSAALALGQPLAGAVVALMYSGGNVLEDIAVARAEHGLRALLDRAPRIAHRRVKDGIEDVPVGNIAVGDRLLVRAGEVVPVDGVVTSDTATIDESALTGEPIPVVKAKGTAAFSGALNAGATFDMTASAVAGESTYAGIVRLVTAAQTAKAPFVRLADRYALVFLPVTLAVAFIAWLISGDLIRSLAVLVAATPCPLILAAPVAFIAGVAQSARRGILVKGGGPLEALARAHTVLFDKTGTLTVGGARLLSIEAAPGESADEVLMLGASLEQASHNVLAGAIVQAATERGIVLKLPEKVREAMGSGLHGIIAGKPVSAGSPDMIFAGQRTSRMGQAGDTASLVAIGADRVHRRRGTADRRAVARRRAARRNAARHPHAARGRRCPHRHGHRRPRRSRRRRSARRSISMPCWRIACPPTRSTRCAPSSGSTRPSWSVTASTTRRRSPRPTSASRWARAAPRASSEAADVVILADRLDRVGDAIVIAQRARRIAVESIFVGMSLSVLAMLAATAGWLLPVPAAIVQEVIDVAVILNALRALNPAHSHVRRTIPAAVGREMHHDHVALIRGLDRLQTIADALDDVAPEDAAALIAEANTIAQEQVVEHERDDEGNVYPRLAKILMDGHGLSAMSRAHREILHLARLLARIVADLPSEKIDRYLIRDAQRVIEAIEALVRIHTAQEEDIYDAVVAR